MDLTQKLRHAVRPAGKSLLAVARWKRLTFNDVPPIFGNSKPKSGSHLLLQILSGICRLMPYAYVESDPVRTITRQGRKRRPEEILSDLGRTPKGVIAWGYLDATPENVGFLCQPGRVNYFIYRDPRDMLVSQVYFATDMHDEHGLHAYYKSLPDFGARLKVAISGIDRDGLHMVNVRRRYQGVFQWLEQKGVLCIRFEDLIDHRDTALITMLEQVEKTGYLIPTPRADAVSLLADAIQPAKSRTFRSGQTGDWRVHFTPEHKILFKEVTGDMLQRLGYEKNSDW